MQRIRRTILPASAACLLAIVPFKLDARDPTPHAIDWAEVHASTLRGIDQLYDLELDSAHYTFTHVKMLAPGDPRGYFFDSMIWFWRYTMTRDEAEYEVFLGRSAQAIEVCDRLLEHNPSDAKTMFYLGGLRGYRGIAHQMNGSILKAAREGTEGYGYLEQAVYRDSSLYDARMGFGLFKYLVGKVPRSLRWLLDLLGFEGDVAGGLDLLREAAAHGLYARQEAAFFLSAFLFAEDRHEEAFSYLTPLIARYPGNSVFRVMSAAWHLRLDRPDRALADALQALEINRRKTVKHGEDIVFATLGAVAFAQNDFAAAREYYGQYAKTARKDSRIWNRNMFRLGVSREITGDRQAAIDAYRSMHAPDSDRSDWDRQHTRRGRELQQAPLTPAGILLLKADNCRRLNDTLAARRFYLEALRRSQNSPDEQAEARYGILQMEYDAGRYENVVQAADSLIDLQPRRETWIRPHALYLLGRSLAGLGRHDAARKAFDTALRFDGYDFQDRLEARIEEEKGKLEAGQSDSGDG